MTIGRIILLSAIPGLMFVIFQVGNFSFRLSWQLVSIWLAGVAFTALLSSGWWRIFFLLALAQVIFNEVVLTSYITLMMIAIFLAAAEGFSRIEPDWIMDAMCIGGVLLSLWIIGQKVGILPAFSLGASGAGPFNRISAGVYLALCLPAFLRQGVRARCEISILPGLCWWHCLPVIAGALYLCVSTTAVFAALAAVMTWVLFKGAAAKVLLIGVVTASLFCSLFFWKADPITGLFDPSRWQYWSDVLRTVKVEPLGRGLGSLSQLVPVIGTKYTGMQQAHNEYVQTGFEMGVQGMAVILAYPVWVGITAWRKRKRLAYTGRIVVSGIAGLAVSCFGWHTFHIAPLAVLGAAWLGMARKEVV